jgi:hypothetical protein
MKITRTHKIYAGLALSALVVGYLIYNRNKKQKQIKLIYDIIDSNVASAGVPSTLTQVQVKALPMGQFPLKLGQQNQLVFNLQQALNKNFNAGIVQDGKFGDSTAKAMCKHVYNFCFTDIQARNFTVDNNDYNKALKLKN